MEYFTHFKEYNCQVPETGVIRLCKLQHGINDWNCGYICRDNIVHVKLYIYGNSNIAHIIPFLDSGVTRYISVVIAERTVSSVELYLF